MKRSAVGCAALFAFLSGFSGISNAADPNLIAARQKIFGIENVDASSGALRKDKVLFSWLGHNTGAVSIQGRIIMMDTYIARLEVTPGRTPFVIQDVVNIKPEALFIGHGVLPESYDPAVDRTSPDVLKSEMGRILGFIRQKVDEQRSHADYLRDVCGVSGA